jgi:hypothetical protein
MIVVAAGWLAVGSGRHERGPAGGAATTTSATGGRHQPRIRRTAAGSRCRSAGSPLAAPEAGGARLPRPPTSGNYAVACGHRVILGCPHATGSSPVAVLVCSPVQPPISEVTISGWSTRRPSRWSQKLGQVTASVCSDGVKGAKAHFTQVQVRAVPGMPLVLLPTLSKEPCWGLGGDPAVDHQVAARFRGVTKLLGPQIASAAAEEPRHWPSGPYTSWNPAICTGSTRCSYTNPCIYGEPPLRPTLTVQRHHSAAKLDLASPPPTRPAWHVRLGCRRAGPFGSVDHCESERREALSPFPGLGNVRACLVRDDRVSRPEGGGAGTP